MRDIWREPAFTFRLLGYGGLVLVALGGLIDARRPGDWLLLAVGIGGPLGWRALVGRLPGVRHSGALASIPAHVVESVLVVASVSLAAADGWLTAIVALVLLAGVAAAGGIRLLLPVLVSVIFVIGLVPGALPALPLNALVGGLLLSGFMLAIALASFGRIRQLSRRQRKALSESAALHHLNTRLSRYLPGDLHPWLNDTPAGSQPPAQRFATVAFVDLVGFTELVSRRPLAELIEVVNGFLAEVTARTEAAGGVVSKFLGDGVLIYFADPDRVTAAVRCAALCGGMEAALGELRQSWQARGVMVGLSVRVGIASGYCAVGDWGSGGRLDYTIIGEPVNLAARLQSSTVPGVVLVSDSTAALIGASDEARGWLGPGREITIKGLGACVVHELSGFAKVRAHGDSDPIKQRPADRRQRLSESLPGRDH